MNAQLSPRLLCRIVLRRDILESMRDSFSANLGFGFDVPQG